MGAWKASFSVAASWIWAPAFFVSGQKAYEDGVIGLFWFVVPNVLGLDVLALFVERVRRGLGLVLIPWTIDAGEGWRTLAAGIPLAIADPHMVSVETVRALLPPRAMIAFSVLALASVVSILDSKLAAVGSLGGHDWAERIASPKRPVSFRDVVRGFRVGMIVVAAVAVAIANLPGLKILHLFLFYGTLRSATFLPTALLIAGWKLDERGVFSGILVSIVGGFPLFAYGNLTENPILIVAGSLLTVWRRARFR